MNAFQRQLGCISSEVWFWCSAKVFNQCVVDENHHLDWPFIEWGTTTILKVGVQRECNIFRRVGHYCTTVLIWYSLAEDGAFAIGVIVQEIKRVLLVVHLLIRRRMKEDVRFAIIDRLSFYTGWYFSPTFSNTHINTHTHNLPLSSRDLWANDQPQTGCIASWE